MSTAGMALYDERRELSVKRTPEEVLAEATSVAVALKKVISLKDKPVMFNGEQYLEFEDWQTCAKFYGCTVKITSTTYVEYGSVAGFEAVAVVLDRDQAEISRAESLCLNDEDNWGMVAEYDWVDKLDADGKKIYNPKGGKNGKGAYERERIKIGEKAKPLFQLKSMAQTRAGARAFRQVFAWVVVLAGYRPSVAEEMTGNEQPRNDADEQPEKKAAVTAPQQTPKDNAGVEEISGVISEARLSNTGSLWFYLGDDKKLVAVAEEKVMDDEMVNGNILTATARKLTNKEGTDFWGVVAVVKCEVVQDGTVAAEDETQDDGNGGELLPDKTVAEVKTAEGAPAAQDDPKAKVAESLKDVFAGKEGGGQMKTGRQVAEEANDKKEKSWRAHVGHDPLKHISYKQGMLTYTITGKNGLNIPDEVVKELLTDVFKCEGHRYLITKEQFPEVLNTLDPTFKFHENK